MYSYELRHLLSWQYTILVLSGCNPQPNRSYVRLARMGWELHTIATFAGHRSTDSTMRYIHLSGRDLAAKLNAGMAQIHAWRVEMFTGTGNADDPR